MITKLMVDTEGPKLAGSGPMLYRSLSFVRRSITDHMYSEDEDRKTRRYPIPQGVDCKSG